MPEKKLCARPNCPGIVVNPRHDFCHPLCNIAYQTHGKLVRIAAKPNMSPEQVDAGRRQFDALTEIELWLNEFATAYNDFKDATK